MFYEIIKEKEKKLRKSYVQNFGWIHFTFMSWALRRGTGVPKDGYNFIRNCQSIFWGHLRLGPVSKIPCTLLNHLFRGGTFQLKCLLKYRAWHFTILIWEGSLTLSHLYVFLCCMIFCSLIFLFGYNSCITESAHLKIKMQWILV